MEHPRHVKTQVLASRELAILKEVIQTYIETGEPVSSRALAKIEKFNLSPASIRNSLADLEDLGFLAQPHTSAGRIPTDLGYRFFVETLMRSRQPGEAEKELIDRELSQVSGDLNRVLACTSKLLNVLTHQVGLVVTAPEAETVFRSIEFVRIDARRVLAVLVAESGVVFTKVIETDFECDGDELRRISNYMAETFCGRSLAGIRAELVRCMEEEKARYDEMMRKIVVLGAHAFRAVTPEKAVFVEGAASMLDQPEFHDVEAMRRLFGAFEEKARLVGLITGCMDAEGVQAIIGSENAFTGENHLSMVLTHYNHPEGSVGSLGILGPTRMEYAKLIPLVEYVGTSLSQKLADTKEK